MIIFDGLINNIRNFFAIGKYRGHANEHSKRRTAFPQLYKLALENIFSNFFGCFKVTEANKTLTELMQCISNSTLASLETTIIEKSRGRAQVKSYIFLLPLEKKLNGWNSRHFHIYEH